MIQPQINGLSDKFITPQGLQQNDQLSVDLNDIVQIICSKYITAGKSFILRSDKLPHIGGHKETFAGLFDELISMIVNHPPPNSKLFLYITLKEQPQDGEVIDLRFAGDIKMYTIDFHTNITSDDQWMSSYKNNLEECSRLIRHNLGSFTFFPICNTGCLFSISLPGKII